MTTRANKSKSSTGPAEPVRDLLKKFKIKDNTVELIIAALLAVTTVATAWSGYQASRWGGVQSTKYSEASALRIESTRASTLAGRQTQIDVGLFTNWVNAYAEENKTLTNFYEDRFRDEFKPAFTAWLDTKPLITPNAPASPFDMPEYVLSNAVKADALEAKASRTFEEGKAANQQSDDYILNTVFLASVLFLAGIATKIRWLPARYGLVVLGFVMLLYGLVNVIRYPIY